MKMLVPRSSALAYSPHGDLVKRKWEIFGSPAAMPSLSIRNPKLYIRELRAAELCTCGVNSKLEITSLYSSYHPMFIYAAGKLWCQAHIGQKQDWSGICLGLEQVWAAGSRKLH